MKLAAPLLAAALALPPAAPAAPAGSLVVKASPVARPCVAAAAPGFGRPVSVVAADVGPVDSARGADVVVAAEEELTRVIEGGTSQPDVDAELGTIPWVLVAPAGAAAPPDVGALERSSATVRVPRGVIARHARASLESLPPERVRSVRADAAAPAAGELALVPLSLAGRGATRATSVPPILVRAVGVRGTARPDAARAFVDFLAAGAGNAAFRACGREGSR